MLKSVNEIRKIIKIIIIKNNKIILIWIGEIKL